MSLSNSIGLYADCREVFDTVVQQSEVTLTFATPGKATHFSQRAYHFRKLYRMREAARRKQPIELVDTPYDGIKIQKKGDGKNQLFISIQRAEFTMEVNGTEVSPVPATPAPEPDPSLVPDFQSIVDEADD